MPPLEDGQGSVIMLVYIILPLYTFLVGTKEAHAIQKGQVSILNLGIRLNQHFLFIQGFFVNADIY